MNYYDTINNEYFSIIRSQTFKNLIKVELLDDFETVVSEITNELSADSSGTLNFTYQQGVRSTVSFSIFDIDGKFLPSDINNSFWIGKKIKIYLGVTLAPLETLLDNFNNFWFSQGIFIINDIQIAKSQSGSLITISGVDKFGFFTADTGYNELQGTYVIPAGTPICQSIIDLLKEDRGNGVPIDPQNPIFDPMITQEVAPYDINKGPSSYLGDFLIEIANVLGCDIYYDNLGHLTLSYGTVDNYLSSKPTVWNYHSEDSEYVSSSIQYNLKDVVNVVKVVGDNINEKIYVGIAENNNPSSDTRISKIGRKEKYITSSFVYNQERADEYAQYELNRNSIVQKSISFQSTLLPHLFPNDVFSLTDSAYNIHNQRFIVQGISYSFGNGVMNLTGSELSNLPYYELREGSSL